MGEGDLIEDKVRLTGASEEVLGGIFTIQHPLVVARLVPPPDSPPEWNCASPVGVISYEIQPRPRGCSNLFTESIHKRGAGAYPAFQAIEI